MIFIAMSCHKDIGEINPGTEQTNQITVPLGFEEIEGDLVGYVFDESNNPIVGAIVSIYSGETATNQYGVFKFENAKMDPQGTFVRVEKSGFLIGSDLVYPNTNGNGTSKIMMLKIIDEQIFQASQGGVIEIQGGGMITFPASSLIRTNGSIYDGEVKSTAYRISPSDPELGVRMSGGLFGLDKMERHRVLSTYGILVIELRGFDNQKLRLKSDKVADLTFPIDDELQNIVEDNVPAWNFDFVEGIWQENIITGNDKQNFYTSINKLGFWNMALPNGISQVCGRLIYNNELPAKNYEVQIINNGLPSRIGITDHDGFFCGKVPLGENLKLQVLHPICGEIIKELNLDPFEDVGTIGDVAIEVDEKYISGTIECNGELDKNSTIIIEGNGQTNIFFPNANGSFSINLEEVLCNSASSFSIFAYNNETEMASEKFELDGNFSESLKLNICDQECIAQLTFRYEKNDYCLNGEFDRMSVEIVDGSGDYAYEWQNGSTNAILLNPGSGQEVCVEVFDMDTDCNYTLCEEVDSYKRLSIESLYSSNTECLVNSGLVFLDMIGGKGNLIYEWTGPDGFTSNDAELIDVSSGIYNVTIQDENGCEIIESSEVYNVIAPINLITEFFCAATTITMEDIDGYKPYTYKWNVEGEVSNQLFVYEPGSYSLTLTDANMCARSSSVTISTVGLLPAINPEYSCEEEIITFSQLDSDYNYYYQSFGSSDKIPANMNFGVVNVSVLETGYQFEIGTEDSVNAECFISEMINLPQFEGLEVGLVNDTSCGSCLDGSIEYEVNTSENCQDCVVGETIVVHKESEEDVTALNDQLQLENGEYYVIVLDSNSGCYIAHELVIVE